MADTKRRRRKSEQINARLESDVYAKLEQIAASEKRTVANVVRIALDEFIERRFSVKTASAA